jgi:tetratricopeptide (TPR) repeat protein
MYVDDEIVLEAEIPETFVTPVLLLQASLGPPGSTLFVDNLEVRAPASAVDESTAIRLEYDLNQRLQRKELVLDVIKNDRSISDEVRALATRMAERRNDAASLEAALERLFALSRLSGEGTAIATAEVQKIPLDTPLNPFQRLIIGELFILGDDPEKAISFIAKAIEDGGTQSFYHKSHGWALWRANRRQEAAEAFEKALGQTKLDAADLDQCVTAYFLDRMSQDELVKRASADRVATAAFAWFYIGQRHESDGSTADAIEAYQKAVDAAKTPDIRHGPPAWSAYRLAKLKEAKGADPPSK